ncbi:RHS repeat domain-containing protein [Rhizobacter sp. OV335]|jgi:RHS repeat-associated protein|uniref:RHS repeat domain-containing protein n=1 Tax=Rhizobacter sp. OV335 TaxID=1500264 RepID=UPI000918003F|nr:RHS repeat-associated core domain-containing protein [Rhizobacter sp. OV335]SHM93137.1 RHS repeat-associated core domain-containing protein [Rhizobacter sp. OV335]
MKSCPTAVHLVYNHARTHDLTMSRYVASDPAGLAGSIGTYTYVENNPLSLIDPNGLKSSDRPSESLCMLMGHNPVACQQVPQNIPLPMTEAQRRHNSCMANCMLGQMAMCSAFSFGGAQLGTVAGALLSVPSGGAVAPATIPMGARAGWVGGQAICRAAVDCEEKCKLCEAAIP